MEEARRKEREEHLRQRGETVRGRSTRARNGNEKPSQMMLDQQDLRHQQKVLRDHGLVMGHVNSAFLS